MENSPLDFSDSLRCADNGWTSLCSCGFSQWEIPGWDYFCSAAQKSVRFLRKRRPLCWLDILEGGVCELRLWLTYAKSTHSLHTPRMLIAALYFGNFTVGGSFQKERSHNRIFNLRAMGSASLRRAFWSLCHSAVLRWLDVSHCVSGKTKGNFLKFCVVRAF